MYFFSIVLIVFPLSKVLSDAPVCCVGWILNSEEIISFISPIRSFSKISLVSKNAYVDIVSELLELIN